MKRKKVWIKANANGTIATGHIRRCMTIAKEMMDRGADIEFILSDVESADALRKFCIEDKTFFDARIMHTRYSEPLDELPILDEWFGDEKPDFFLMDSYYLSLEYFEGINQIIKKHSLSMKTGYIDDLYKFDYPVDLIINFDLEIPDDFYNARIQLLGVKYAPLRRQFGQNDYYVRDSAKLAFLSSGGTDPCHVIGNILKEAYSQESPCRKVLADTGIRFDVLVGALFEDDYKKELKQMADSNESITLYESVSDIAGIMKNADLAVSAGGTTLYELCSIGVPTVVFSMADNQMEFVKAFDKAGAVKYAGDARYDHRLVQKIVTWGTAAVDNKGFRKRMSDKAKSLIDGKGAERIAEGVMEFI